MAFIVSGVTRDGSGEPLPNCAVYLLKYASGIDAFTQVDSDVSDGSGAYELTAADDDPNHVVVAFDESGAPVLAGLTRRDLEPDPAFPDPIAPPSVDSKSVYVMNMDTNQVYYVKDLGGEDRPVSMIKLMTVWLALEWKGESLSETVTIVSDDLTEGGTGNNLQAGDIWSLDSLIWNLVVASSNNGSKALGRAIGQHILDLEEDTETDPVVRFIAAMNEEAAARGMTGTTFENTGGFPVLNTVMPADDTAIIAKLLYLDPRFARYAGWVRREVDITRSGSPLTIVLESANLALHWHSIRYAKGGSVGGGSPTFNMATHWVAPNGQNIAVVTMGGESNDHRYDDTEAIIEQLPVDFPALAIDDGWDFADLFTDGVSGAWLDPSDMSTLYQDAAGTTPVTAADQPVGRIEDKSGNGNHATQSTASRRPILRTDGTLWWLEFDGTDDFLTFGATSLGDTGLFTGSGEEFAVLTVTSTTDVGSGTRTVISRAVSTLANRTFQIYWDNGFNNTKPGLRLRGTNIGVTTLELNDGNRHVVGAMWDGSSASLIGESAAHRHGQPGTAAENTAQNIVIGARSDGPAQYLMGTIHQIVIVDTVDRHGIFRAANKMLAASTA
jgi:D-alanyl-D-alanine carboxypeptidase